MDDVYIVDQLYLWTDHVLLYGLVALRVWALADCMIRKLAAFPAVDKLSKPAWVAMLLLGGLAGTFISPPTGPISLISAVVACVYLADVRPAVRQITGGTGR